MIHTEYFNSIHHHSRLLYPAVLLLYQEHRTRSFGWAKVAKATEVGSVQHINKSSNWKPLFSVYSTSFSILLSVLIIFQTLQCHSSSRILLHNSNISLVKQHRFLSQISQNNHPTGGHNDTTYYLYAGKTWSCSQSRLIRQSLRLYFLRSIYYSSRGSRRILFLQLLYKYQDVNLDLEKVESIRLLL